MQYDVNAEPRHGGLPWDPFKAIVAPRPIGWITTLSADGVVNLAPYSYFMAVADKPNVVMFSSDQRKDSQRNAEASGEFVASVCSFELREAMNSTSASLSPDRSEPTEAGIRMAPSRRVLPPRVAQAPAALECTYLGTQTIPLGDGRVHRYQLVFGRVVAVHIDDDLIRDGRYLTAEAAPVMRMGYDEYAQVDSVFRLARPDDDPVGDGMLR